MDEGLTIVMYHYVRDLKHSAYPRIKGRTVDEFRNQLRHVLQAYVPVSVEQVADCFRRGRPLPERAALLTFDDGYSDHYENVFPLLAEVGVQGAFFPPVQPIRDNKLLDVNRVHFLLAVADAASLAREIDGAVREARDAWNLLSVEEYHAEWAKPNRFDDGETIYVKRMLQTVLPEEMRNGLAHDLFTRFVAHDEAAFARQLYLSVDQLAEMRRSGMHIGSHGSAHYWLNRVDGAAQARDIDESLDFLRLIGCPIDELWTFCYPYGGWNEELVKLLEARNCALAFTTETAVAQPGRRHHRLLLPRLDTNDLSM